MKGGSKNGDKLKFSPQKCEVKNHDFFKKFFRGPKYTPFGKHGFPPSKNFRRTVLHFKRSIPEYPVPSYKHYIPN